MHIVIAMDSFKGCLSSIEAGHAVAEGIRRALPSARLTVRALADGGEGTVDALVSGQNGHYETAEVSDPLGRRICARYGMAGGTAFLEMAAAAGLPLLSPEERNPLYTTSYGVGELIADAVGKGCRDFIIGIGGSATNDGGVGMLSALGYRFTDADGAPIPPGAAGLERLARIDGSGALPALRFCRFCVACDVTNPLCGPTGCSAVYGPQKGADAGSVEKMDGWLAAYAEKMCRIFPEADPAAPGAGAAGGLGFALSGCLHAVLTPGAALIMERTGLTACIDDADFVVTGEGCLDAQTAMGKAPAGVAALATTHGVPVIALAGSIRGDTSPCHRAGVSACFAILREPCTLGQAMDPSGTRARLAATAEEVFGLLAVRRPDRQTPEGAEIQPV